MISIAKPLIGAEEMAAVQDALASGQLAQGARVRRFEEEFADWVGVQHAIAVTSGTAALHVALLAADIGTGDEVVTSPFSFVASANCALFVGARPTFADIEAPYYTMDPAAIRAAITPATRALVVVHLYGQPCAMDEIMQIADEHNLLLVEDACQAHGASWQRRCVGSMGVGCFSFYPTKNMTTGEGGMITTDDPEIARRARLLREHGAPQRYVHEVLGYNLRMTDIQAAMGIVQLGKVSGWNRQRASNAAYLSEKLAGLPGISTPDVRHGASHVFHQYTIRADDRTALAAALAERGVGTAIHYATPIHHQPLYRDLGYTDSLPNAEAAAREVLSLPVHPALSEGDLVHIAAAVADAAHMLADAHTAVTA
jgi:dTDP-4-amino-4,6-dideoxygalactose transaminase